MNLIFHDSEICGMDPPPERRGPCPVPCSIPVRYREQYTDLFQGPGYLIE